MQTRPMAFLIVSSLISSWFRGFLKLPKHSHEWYWHRFYFLFNDKLSNLSFNFIKDYLQGCRITFHHGDFYPPLSSRKHGTNIYVQCGKLVATIIMKINWKSKSKIRFWQIAHKLFWNFCLGSFCTSFVWTQKRFCRLPYSFFIYWPPNKNP